MARYTVNVAAGSRRASLLVVHSPEQLCSALLQTVKSRLPTLANKLSLIDTDNLQITLHLNTENGPMLDLEDLLSDVLPDPKEIVYAVINAQQELHTSSSQPTQSAGAQTLRIRVITPESAQQEASIDAINPLSTRLPVRATLRQLKGLVQEHLGFPTDDGDCPELECNCSFAQQIDRNTTLNTTNPNYHHTLPTVVVVHSNNDVTTIPIKCLTLNTIKQAVRNQFPWRLINKIINAVGGIQDTNVQHTGDTSYVKAPVLAICSSKCQGRDQGHDQEDSYRDLIVDVHTSECPIELTAHNADITIAASGLEDCAVNGVLNVFAAQRWTLGQSEVVAPGKAGIFKASEAWEHVKGQSDRGISNLLSTLRVFTSLASGSKLEDERQDAVLHMIHLLTRFPPAVRAAYILMRGETPRPSERAALAQCLYEVLKKVIPLQTVRSDPKRFFEGTRLLFGLILEKAKNMKLSKLHSDSALPYIDMWVYDLRNMVTMSAVLSFPVHTASGLVDRGFYQAFDNGGPLRWTNGTNTQKIASLDQAWSRIATISGGTKAQIVAYNADAVRTSTRYADGGDISKIVSPAEYTDLTYLANLCSRNELTVVPPSELASADAPVLTLDREGSLAVYVGREACGAPGRDILMFRPTNGGEDEGVDVSIINGLLEPILAHRTANGTIVFEAYGSHHRKVFAPDEITMLCVDLSCSMTDRCGFVDVESNEDGYAQIKPTTRTDMSDSNAAVTENPAFHLPDVDELKEYLKAHESYGDFLAILRTGRDDYHRRQNAEKVLQILKQLHDQEIETKSKELESMRQRATQYFYRIQSNNIDRDVNTLKNRSLRLQRYKNLICAWLITCLGKDASVPDPLMWTPGDHMPTVPKTVQQTRVGYPEFEIPRDYCCHISNEIMEDPVTTFDNYTYERRNIERWLLSNERSPLTNLILPSNDLRPNIQIKEQIAAYLNCSDITSKCQSANTMTDALHVTFRSPLETRSMYLSQDLELRDLWEVAFRLTKGRYPKYDLQHLNALIPTSQDPISGFINVDYEVFIIPATTVASTLSPGAEELCLVKVYDATCIKTVVSYWEPKTTTKSLASAVFRYYRQKFTTRSSTPVEAPFTFWTKMYHTGDDHRTGSVLTKHWETLSQYFVRSYCSGTLADEGFVDKAEDSENDGASLPIAADQPLVFKLRLGRAPRCEIKRQNTLSRLDVLKQMFNAYINRLLAYNFQSHVGLVTFSTKASLSQKITNAVENFRHKLNDMAASGDTAIWDSIALAQDQLREYAKQYPNAKLRIICISDGVDNKSMNTAAGLSSRLSQDGIVVDSFCLGDTKNKDLQTLSYLSGGYTFEPETLDEAMAICEMEPVLSLLERATEVKPTDRYHRDRFHKYPTISNFRQASRVVHVNRVTQDSFPKRKQHPELENSFVELGHFAKKASQHRTDSNVRLSRIHNEIRDSGARLHPHYDVYICESNMDLWKIVMQGPPDSTYDGGTFLLYIKMGNSYPMSPPEARFITPIYHPNINRHGRICHSILDRNWVVDTTKDLIDTVYSLLLVPEFSDPVNTVVTLNYHWDEVEFKKEAQAHIKKHASKTRAEWRQEIVG